MTEELRPRQYAQKIIERVEALLERVPEHLRDITRDHVTNHYARQCREGVATR